VTDPDLAPTAFRRVNLFQLKLTDEMSHDGHGSVRQAVVASREDVAAACHGIFYVELPPGTSVGEHVHDIDSEEYYLILSGSGRMRLGDEMLDVSDGDLIRNDPGQIHGLTNTGADTLRMYVFDAEARRRGSSAGVPQVDSQQSRRSI
jgi:mannose-6-phosphate isomerase-like protein (cupin superfamily)